MPIQINTSKIPVWLNSDELKLGLEPNDQVLRELTNSQERLIELLFKGVAPDQLEIVGSSVGLTELETNDLVERLRPSLTNQNANNSQSLDVRFAELIRIGFHTNQPPGEVLAKRADYLVQLPQLNRTGLTMIKVLAEVGFKRFETNDYSAIEDSDCGELGFPRFNLGRARIDGVRESLSSTRTISVDYPTKATRKQKRFTVLAANHQLVPSEYRHLSDPHLSIEYRVDSVFVSSIIIPGRTPCLGCRDLWLQENDDNWLAQSIQLTARKDQLDDGPSLLMASAVAARNFCNFVDEDFPGNSIAVNMRTRNHSVQNWDSHPSCNCLSAKPN